MVNHKYILIVLVCGCLLWQTARAQDKAIDSLVNLVNRTQSDSLKSIYFGELATEFSGYDTLKASRYLQQAFQICQKINTPYTWGYYYKCSAVYLYDRGLYTRSLSLADSAVDFFKASKISEGELAHQLAEVLAGKGAVLTVTTQMHKALTEYQLSLNWYEKSTNPLKDQRIGALYNSMGNVFFLLKEYEKGLQYDLRSVPYFIAAKDEEMQAFAYTFVAADYMRLLKFDSAKLYFDKADPIVKKLNKNSINVEYYGKIGEMYWWQRDWANTRKYYTLAYENAKAINQGYNEIEYLRGIGNCFYNEAKHAEADNYFKQAEKLTEQYNLEATQRDLYWTMSRNYHHMGKFELASNYMLRYTKLNDSVASSEFKQRLAEMEEQFNAQKRDQEIIQLQKQKEIQQLSLTQKSTLNYILFGSIAVLLLIGYLAYRNMRTKQKLSKQTEQLQAQRIRELEQEKQLVAFNSLLKGQEEERGRLAKDLHDGLGGMLSGVKLSLGAMKGNLILSEDTARLFSRALDQLDNSISEMRRVAHNMMPEALVKLGLQQAVQDYCDGLTETQQLKINCQFHGLEKRLDAATEIVVYRIAQELLNNVVKHAEATEALVQIMRHENNLNITIEDNGKGFDTSKMDDERGAGLRNVQSRVDYLKGQMDIQSSPGKGTSVHIDCVLEAV